MPTDRDIALVKAALEAADAWLLKWGWTKPHIKVAEIIDPAAIAATVEESDPLPAMIEAHREVVRWQSLCGDLFQASHRDAKRIAELEDALRQRTTELEAALYAEPKP